MFFFLVAATLGLSRGLVLVEGDATIALLAHVTRFDHLTEDCGHVDEVGVKTIEAARFLVQQANEEILTDGAPKLGLSVVNTCHGLGKAVSKLSEPLVDFTRKCNRKSFYQPRPLGRLLGVLGLDSLREVKELWPLVETLSVPVISYAASNPALSTKGQWPTLLRSIPCDCGLYGHMAKLISGLGPARVGIVYEETLYGTKSLDLLRGGFQTRSIFPFRETPIPLSARPDELRAALRSAAWEADVVAIVSSAHTRQLFLDAFDVMEESELGAFVVPANLADAVENKSHGQHLRAVLYQLRPQDELQAHFDGLCDDEALGAKVSHWWLLWRLEGNPSAELCRRLPASRLAFLANGIRAYAHALKRFSALNCAGIGLSGARCGEFASECWGRERLWAALKDVRFPLAPNATKSFRFNRSGDAFIKFHLARLQRDQDGHWEWVEEERDNDDGNGLG